MELTLKSVFSALKKEGYGNRIKVEKVIF